MTCSIPQPRVPARCSVSPRPPHCGVLPHDFQNAQPVYADPDQADGAAASVSQKKTQKWQRLPPALTRKSAGPLAHTTVELEEKKRSRVSVKVYFTFRVGTAYPVPRVLCEVGNCRIGELFGTSKRLDLPPRAIMQARGHGEDAGCIGISVYKYPGAGQGIPRSHLRRVPRAVVRQSQRARLLRRCTRSCAVKARSYHHKSRACSRVCW